MKTCRAAGIIPLASPAPRTEPQLASPYAVVRKQRHSRILLSGSQVADLRADLDRVNAELIKAGSFIADCMQENQGSRLKHGGA